MVAFVAFFFSIQCSVLSETWYGLSLKSVFDTLNQFLHTLNVLHHLHLVIN